VAFGLSARQKVDGIVGALFSIREAGHAPDGSIGILVLKALATKLETEERNVSATLPRNVIVEPL
jgi:hypothetical protein